MILGNYKALSSGDLRALTDQFIKLCSRLEPWCRTPPIHSSLLRRGAATSMGLRKAGEGDVPQGAGQVPAFVPRQEGKRWGGLLALCWLGQQLQAPPDPGPDPIAWSCLAMQPQHCTSTSGHVASAARLPVVPREGQHQAGGRGEMGSAAHIALTAASFQPRLLGGALAGASPLAPAVNLLLTRSPAGPRQDL